jgi:hypothetical protein
VQSDRFSHTLRRVDVLSGAVTTLAGRAGTSGTANGVGSAAQFGSPRQVTVDAAGQVAIVVGCQCKSCYVREGGRRKKSYVFFFLLVKSICVANIKAWLFIEHVRPTVATHCLVRTLSACALSGCVPRVPVQADYGNNCIRHVVVSSGTVTTLAGTCGVELPFTDGVGTAATFLRPHGTAVDAAWTFALVVGATVTGRGGGGGGGHLLG